MDWEEWSILLFFLWNNIFLFLFLFLATLIVGAVFVFCIRLLYIFFLDLTKRNKIIVAIFTSIVLFATFYFFVILNWQLWFKPRMSKEGQKLVVYQSSSIILFILVVALVILGLVLVIWVLWKKYSKAHPRVSIEYNSMEIRIIFGKKRDPKKEERRWKKAQKIILREIEKHQKKEF
ncbi:MAG: hypothetical protein WC822_00480 [Candidatus Paceibacterota bacterium]|jgi:hypothetical protein